MKLLINDKKKKLYPDKITQDLNTNNGIILKKDFNSKKEKISSHKGIKFLKTKPNFKDIYSNLARGPQIIRLKDAAFISSQLGLMKGYKVLDCGGGSGALTCYFANMVGSKGKVVSVERKQKFVKIIKENALKFGFKNINAVNSDLKDYKTKKRFDAINLDLLNPWDYIDNVETLLKNGGMLSVYAPNTTQLTKMQKQADNSNLKLKGAYELLQREWKIKDKVCRPKFNILGHTGFVMIFRKVKL